MITASILNAHEGAYLGGEVRLEGAPAITVKFLVDTGAFWTTTSANDTAALDLIGLPYLQSSPISVRTLGGPTRMFTSPALITFRHTDGQLTVLGIHIGLEPSGPVPSRFPSLLGMDVLSLGMLMLGRGRVSFDIEPGTHLVPAPWEP